MVHNFLTEEDDRSIQSEIDTLLVEVASNCHVALHSDNFAPAKRCLSQAIANRDYSNPPAA